MGAICAVAALLLPLVTATATASADPDSPPEGHLTLHPIIEPLTAPRSRQAAIERDSETYVAPLAASGPRKPPASPNEGELDPCWMSEGGGSVQGRVYNRFLWCQRNRIGAEVRDEDGDVEGHASFVMRAVAYGRDDGDRSVRVFMRAEKGTMHYENGEWPFPNPMPSAIFHIWVDCVTWLGGCSAGGATVGGTFRDWENDDSWHYWTVSSSENGGSGPDLVRRHDWQFKIRAFSHSKPDVGPMSMPPHKIRCDSATVGFPKSRSKACIMDDVIPHMQYSLRNPKVLEVAQHIQCAQDPGCLTWPLKQGKQIPGKFTGDRDDPALHRIMENQTQYGKNSYQKTQACNQGTPYFADGLPPHKYDKTTQQCDEYPFASSKEGAGVGDWNFSVLGVNGRQNSCAGNALGRYYKDDRILVWREEVPEEAQDPYYVHIHDRDENASDEYCTNQDDEGGTPNQPPTVNAGPDVTGDEGFLVPLYGSASDPEGEVGVHWTYAPGPGTDAGASCFFTRPHSANTEIQCNDDGTFTVTLTASDGVNASVSDSATVTLRNVPPRIRRLMPQLATSEAADVPGIVKPQPWQVFKAGEPVTFEGRFTEPAQNDTHECTVDWDDGTVETFASSGRACKRTHTFAHPGMYTIKPRVADDDTGADTDTVMVIVYDPDAGSATAGGFIDSPAGALTADPAATGKAHFTFNPKYHKQDDGPAPSGGKVAFRLDGSGFSLTSRTLEWLVVTPDGKVAVKGVTETGTRFVAYGYDDPDRFRIVAWTGDPIPGQAVVYDNRPGVDYDLDLTEPQDTAGGSITIHH
ncbi:PKD domain-containing protein [Nonomuraea sp. NPDC050663]|uniref:PKD domain-containing protein n=1 Tax=Nonomuraea sp. NPDC050663 TaxID=3364370 RepID=UPI00379B1FD2